MRARRRRWALAGAFLASVALLAVSVPNAFAGRDESVKGVDEDYRLQAPVTMDPLTPSTRYSVPDLFLPHSFADTEVELATETGETLGLTVTIPAGGPAGALDVADANGTALGSFEWTAVSGESLGKSLQSSLIGSAPFVHLRLVGVGAIMLLDYASTFALANGDTVDVATGGSLGFLVDPAHLGGLGPNERAVVEVAGQGPVRLRAWDHLFHEIGDVASSDDVRLPLRTGHSEYARLLLQVQQPQTVRVTVSTAAFPAPVQVPWGVLVLLGMFAVAVCSAVLVRQIWRRRTDRSKRGPDHRSKQEGGNTRSHGEIRPRRVRGRHHSDEKPRRRKGK